MHVLVCSSWGAWVSRGEGGEEGGACGAKDEERGSGGRGGGKEQEQELPKDPTRTTGWKPRFTDPRD